MTGTNHVDQIEVVLLCEVIEMGINEGEAGAGSPVTEKSVIIREHRFWRIRKSLEFYLGLMSSNVRSRSRYALSDRKIIASKSQLCDPRIQRALELEYKRYGSDLPAAM